MRDKPRVKVYGHGLPDETTLGGPPGEAPTTAVVSHNGVKVVFRFARGDVFGEGDVQEIWIRPDTEPLEPRVLGRVGRLSALYLAHVRATMRLLAPPDEKGRFNVEERWARMRASGKALREAGRTRRGLSDPFYRLIAEQYQRLVADGEPYPVKTLAEIHDVTISAASRWITEARRRGYIKEPSPTASA